MKKLCLLLASFAAFCLFIGPAPAIAQISQVDLASRSKDSNDSANGLSETSVVSGDGLFIAYASTATDIVENDTNGQKDVFLHDRLTKTSSLISIDGIGVQGTGDSGAADLTFGGRQIAINNSGSKVAFISDASNFATTPGDGNLFADIFLKDRNTNAMVLVSVNPATVPANSDSAHPAIDASGTFVAFDSSATNLILTDANTSVRDIFLRDVTSFAGTAVTVVSLTNSGNQGDADSSNPSISSDANLVAFMSVAQNYIDGEQSPSHQIYVRNRNTSTIHRISQTPSGTPSSSSCRPPQISGDGNFLVFASQGTNLDNRCNNGKYQLYLANISDLNNPQITCISRGPQAQGNEDSGNLGQYAISQDGRYVSFKSESSNLLPKAVGVGYTYLYDRVSDQITLVSQTKSGQESLNPTTWPGISNDGKVISFGTASNLLVTPDTNNNEDVFYVVPAERPFTLVPGTKIENPPGVAVNGTTVSFTFQKFSGVKEKKPKKSELEALEASKNKITVQYQVTITHTDAGGSIRRLTSKKNVLTVKNLAAGQYQANYRAFAVKNGERVFKTGVSPTQVFQVGG